jgi:hypothetical protein
MQIEQSFAISSADDQLNQFYNPWGVSKKVLLSYSSIVCLFISSMKHAISGESQNYEFLDKNIFLLDLVYT